MANKSGGGLQRSIFTCMYRYFIKTPLIARLFFPSYVWSVDTKEKEVYLTFDDGPDPEVTPWVLEQLRAYNAEATFFCIGKNVKAHPYVYNQIIGEGHAVGNHTYHHLNGWKVGTRQYLEDITAAAALIDSNLFRPPYGKIKWGQSKAIAAALNSDESKVIMWDVLSADFDVSLASEKCLQNVLGNYGPGSIIVFHDSQKAFRHLQFVLPRCLADFRSKGYICRKIECIR